ncbi:MAG: dienelactone hydrolase family protein [Terriglobales bacterium]
MKNRPCAALLLIAFTFACTALAGAQEWAKTALEKSPRHQEWANIKHGDRTVNAFVVYPEVKGKATTVIVIHENAGLTDWTRTVADQLAAAGYIAIAPDLLSGMAPAEMKPAEFPGSDAARQAIRKLTPEGVTSDLNAVFDYAKKLPAANGKVAVGGFCWGGGQTFRYATNQPALAGAFVFYGPPPAEGMANIKAPVYGFYGGDDARITATVPKTAEDMKAAGKTFDQVTYEGAGHGFMRSGMAPEASEANKKAREQAWERWLKLLKDAK